MKNIFNKYARWGLAKKQPSLEVVLSREEPLADEIKKSVDFLSSKFNLDEYKLLTAYWVNYYQGTLLDNIKVMFLRFSQNEVNTPFKGEHLSFLIDMSCLKIMGLTNTEVCADSENYIEHQKALPIAIEFLKIHAPDLVNKEALTPKIATQKSTSKIQFDPPLVIDNVEVHWIGPHQEKVFLDNKTAIIYGTKVKMYIPESQLWTWVIINNKEKIQTFERNIFWNFKAFQRETQMWLHDEWLTLHAKTMMSELSNSFR